MGVVVRFPVIKKPRSFGIFNQVELVAAKHMVCAGKGFFVPIATLGTNRNSIGEIAIAAVEIQGHAINEYEGLCVYLFNDSRGAL